MDAEGWLDKVVLSTRRKLLFGLATLGGFAFERHLQATWSYFLKLQGETNKEGAVQEFESASLAYLPFSKSCNALPAQSAVGFEQCSRPSIHDQPARLTQPQAGT